MLASGELAPDEYRMLLQEDGVVEWATVWLFLFAGIAGLVTSMRARRLGDALVALFCLFVAGEEFSWGQRLLGYYPPDFFLANNFQQEATLHNIPQAIIQPKWILMMALAGYGVLLPLLARRSGGAALLDTLGATAPPVRLLAWFAAAIALLWWYPLTLTGEWVEALAGALFLFAAAAGSATKLMAMLAAGIALGATMTIASAFLENERDVTRIACVRQEVKTLTEDLVSSAGTEELWGMRRVHKRLWSAIQEGYVDGMLLRSFSNVSCDGPPDENSSRRRRFGLDPWGSPYWLHVEEIGDGVHEVTFYSFGPNRRRDVPAFPPLSGDLGDDVVELSLRTPAPFPYPPRVNR